MFFGGAGCKAKVSLSHGPNSRLSRDERLRKAREERDVRERQRREKNAALIVQRVFRGRRVARQYRKELRMTFDKRCGDLQRVAAILTASGKPFYVPLTVLVPLIRAFNLFHCTQTSSTDQFRISTMCNFLLSSFHCPSPSLNYGAQASVAQRSALLGEEGKGAPKDPCWVFQCVRFLRSCLNMVVHADNPAEDGTFARLMLDMVDIATCPSGWGIRREPISGESDATHVEAKAACALVLLHLSRTQGGEASIVSVLVHLLSNATVATKVAKDECTLMFQTKLCALINRAFSSTCRQSSSSPAVVHAFEELTKKLLPLPFLSRKSTKRNVNLMVHLMHPLLEISTIWRSCLYSVLRWIPGVGGREIDFPWMFANVLRISRKKTVTDLWCNDKEALTAHVSVLLHLIPKLPMAAFISAEEGHEVAGLQGAADNSFDDEEEDVFQPRGQETPRSSSTDLTRVIRCARMHLLSDETRRFGDDAAIAHIKNVWDVTHAKILFDLLLPKTMVQPTGPSADGSLLPQEGGREAVVLKLGVLFNTVFEKAGVLVNPVVHHGLGQTTLNALALQNGRYLIPRLWTALNHALNVEEFARAGTVPNLTSGQAKDGDVESTLALFFTLYGHLLVVLDNFDFYVKEIPFPISEQRRIIKLLSDLLFRMMWTEQPTTLEPPLYPLSKTRLILAACNLYNKLYDRNCRKAYTANTAWEWTALPAEHVVFGTESTKSTPDARFRAALLLQLIPQVLSFDQRILIFNRLLQKQMSEHYEDRGHGVRIVVRRKSLYEDAFSKLNPLKGNLKGRIQISFVDEYGVEEAGIDGGGLFKEFMTSLCKRAFDPQYGMFKEAEGGALYPNPSSSVVAGVSHLEHFSFLGRILGKAVYESILVEPQFSKFFLNKVLGRVNYVDDLMSLDSDLYENLLQLKSLERVEDADLNFTTIKEEYGEYTSIELIPNGTHVTVTNENCLTYIYSLANYRLNTEISQQSKAFLRGFRDIIPTSCIRIFNQEELQNLIGGSEKSFDIVDMAKFTTYSTGYHPSQPYIQEFWKFVDSLDYADRGHLLRFWTSCSRPPLLGFQTLNPPLCIQKIVIQNDRDRLPTAGTCMNLLKLPEYSSVVVMKEKLLLALRSAKNGGFGLS